jgi:hypothetical protein
MNERSLNFILSSLSKPTLRSILEEIYPLIHGEKKEDLWNGMSEEEIRKDIVAILCDEELIPRLFGFLSTYEREVLCYFVFHVGEDFLTYRQIEKGLQGIQPTIFRLGLTGLRRKGIIFTVRRQWGEVAYILPQDLEPLFYSMLLKAEGTNLDGIEKVTDPVEIDLDERPLFFADLFFLLDEIRSTPNGEIPLTQKGTVHKRYIRSWQERLIDREEELSSRSLSFEHRDTYTNQTAILLDFLTRKELLYWFEGSLQINHDGVNAWMSLSRKEMAEQFLDYWFTYYTSATPWLQRYQKDMCQYRLRSNDWIYLFAFVEQWEDRYTLPPIQELKQQLQEEIFQPLRAFGLVQWGRTGTGEEVWRWTKQEDSLADIWIQPTMEIYCSGFIPLSDLWQLTKMSTFDKWENMLVLNFSESRCKQSMEQGESVGKWLEWLRSHSKIPIPQGVEDQINQWKKSQQQALITDMTVIEIKDEYLAKAFVQWPEAQSLSFRQISETIFVVPLRERESVCQLLIKKGVQLKRVKEEDIEEGNQVPSTSSLITFSKDVESSYRVESVFPDLTEAIPAWNGLPDMWKKQFASYHDRTKRDMIEQAVRHHLLMKVEDTCGRIKEVAPIECKVEEGHWVCYDQQRSRYKVANINRIQLMFPGTVRK